MASLDYFVAPNISRSVMKQATVREEDVLPDRMDLQKVAQLLAQGSRSPGGRFQLYHAVKGAMDKTAADIASLRYRLEFGARELVKTAEQAIKEGASVAEIARVMLGDSPDEATIEVAENTLSKIGAELDPARIPWGREITPDHPLRLQTDGLAKIANQLIERFHTHSELESQFAEISRKVRVDSELA